MSLIFCDSFNHEGPLAPKWDFPIGGSIQNLPAIARSGNFCMQVSNEGNNGIWKNLGVGLQVVQYTKLIAGCALNFDALPALQSSDIYLFDMVIPGQQTPNIIVTLNADGSFSVFRGPGDNPFRVLLGTSVTAPFVFNPAPTVSGVWNYLEAKVLIDPTKGSVELRLAPAPTGPMAVILSLTGLNTCAFVAQPFTNQLKLNGPGALNQHAYYNDFYLNDWSDGSSYRGGVKIFAGAPFANGVPVQFTPLAPPNWSQVNEIPPDNDSSYNFSGTPGQTDQYQHNAGVVPIGSQIQAVQHVMDFKTDTGARAITSVVGGVVSPNSVYLSNGYSMQTYPYDLNPITGLPWKASDFPVSFGPQVTA